MNYIQTAAAFHRISQAYLSIEYGEPVVSWDTISAAAKEELSQLIKIIVKSDCSVSPEELYNLWYKENERSLKDTHQTLTKERKIPYAILIATVKSVYTGEQE